MCVNHCCFFDVHNTNPAGVRTDLLLPSMYHAMSLRLFSSATNVFQLRCLEGKVSRVGDCTNNGSSSSSGCDEQQPPLWAWCLC